jgi:hypothetical protein
MVERRKEISFQICNRPCLSLLLKSFRNSLQDRLPNFTGQRLGFRLRILASEFNLACARTRGHTARAAATNFSLIVRAVASFGSVFWWSTRSRYGSSLSIRSSSSRLRPVGLGIRSVTRCLFGCQWNRECNPHWNAPLGVIRPTAANLTANHILTIKMRSVSFLLMTKRSSCAHDHNAE